MLALHYPKRVLNKKNGDINLDTLTTKLNNY